MWFKADDIQMAEVGLRTITTALRRDETRYVTVLSYRDAVVTVTHALDSTEEQRIARTAQGVRVLMLLEESLAGLEETDVLA